jgi:hypothetical protein
MDKVVVHVSFHSNQSLDFNPHCTHRALQPCLALPMSNLPTITTRLKNKYLVMLENGESHLFKNIP